MRLVKLKRFSWIVLAAILILSNAIGLAPARAFAANADGSLTVAEAIASNTGTGTVEGYIVGHATGSLSKNMTAPFSNDYNFLIADTAGEQDNAKLLDVQLTSSYRSEFGLQTNPDIIGMKVKVSGSLALYNSYPGLKSPTSIAFMEEDTTPTDPSAEVVSITDAKQASGTVTIEGIVTADNSAIGGGKLSTFVQDSTGGINIYHYSTAGFPDLVEGDQIQVTGSITSYMGLTEISPSSITVIAQNQPMPAPVQLSLADLQDPAIAEPYEGQLVHLTGYFQTVPARPAGGGYNIQAVDQDFNGTTFRIMEGSMDISAILANHWYDVTGILSQYNSYQVIPRKAADVVLASDQPPLYPSAPGEYEGIVDHVVDGDTIALQSPVLGATNVRFLNIDTPESDAYMNLNGGVQTPADQNQLDFGLSAKQYMETLLQPGYNVILKVGEESIDKYGRLLAEVVRESDSLNVNLDMVEQGYAVTYFISPIGSLEEYNHYQAAVKTAMDQAIGIWDMTNPLQELPFVFRARFSGDGLSRPVGNSDTFKYVDKEDWASVPVEKRIFFNTEADAIANGYTSSDQVTTPPLPDGTGKKVLFDNTHGQTAGAADWVIDGAFSDFADGLRADGFTVAALERPIPYTFGEQAVTYDALKDYDVFIIGEANIPYKTSEQEALIQYVQDGGSIFFIADHYNADRNKNRWDASEIMNGYRRGAWSNPAQGMTAEEAASPAMQDVESSDWLADNFGVRFRYNALGDVDNMTNVVSADQSFGITEDVGSVAMHAGSTLAILDGTKAKGLVYVPTNVSSWGYAVDSGVYSGGGQAEGPFAAVSKLGAGKAAFIGDSSPVEDATPKYLREENGSKKTTYDGFSGEADDATFLVQTVEWLANQEDYTSFAQVVGLELDEPTELLSFEAPAQSTEPQAEPWAAPEAGYKWYDPSTFKAGSYGSSQQSSQPTYSFVHQDTLPSAEIFQIRVAADNLLPGQSVSGLTVGLYLPGGTQIAKIQNEDGAWPTSYGYSSSFSMTADGTGHAAKDLTVQLNPTAAGSASLRLKVNGNNEMTEAVTIADVPAEPLPEDEAPVPAAISIAEARQSASNALVTVEGVITSEPGTFGGQGFYLQDATGGIYVYQTSSGFHAGDQITISAMKTVYNTELELTDPVALEKIGTAATPQAVVQNTLNDENQGMLVSLQNVTIQNYIAAAPTGSFEFDAVKDSGFTHVRIDGRTGIGYEDFQSAFPAGSTVNITGISAIYQGNYQLKPLAMSDVVLANSAVEPPTTTLFAYGVTGENNYNTQDVLLTLTAQDSAGGSNIASIQYRLNNEEWMSAGGPVVVSTEGQNLIEYYATDNAGNVEAVQSAQIWIDKTAPMLSLSGSMTFYQSHAAVPFYVTANDNADGSGVNALEYTLDDSSIPSLAWIDPLALTLGTHSLIVTAEDIAGNQTSLHVTLTSRMDIDHFAQLIELGESNGWITKHSTAKELISQVEKIQKAKKDKKEEKRYEALIKKITKESGKHIDIPFADLLLADIAFMQASDI
nr:DUF6359 domain-containing protein [Paenibacillus sp. HB172176]